MESNLLSTYYIDKDHPDIIRFAGLVCKGLTDDLDKALGLYYAVRDEIGYNPYVIESAKSAMRASGILKKGEGFCVAKAVLLTACVRSQGIPARLGFADVKNHLNTQKLREIMGTDIFVWHGYSQIYLNGKWVKATPAFDLNLCQNFNVRPLEFDGINDSIFHPFDTRGNKHMEYLIDHGSFSDLPWERIMAAYIKAYPRYFEILDRKPRDFSAEALEEKG
ncbi:MAG: transglutaminase domain-containing protein [Desulfobacteraceae bacterium]|nr:transglutaminase domain-containing protein [Desulfobacteraceae bacterium]